MSYVEKRKPHLGEDQRYKEYHQDDGDGFTGEIHISPKSPRVPGQFVEHPDVDETIALNEKRTGKGTRTFARQSWGYNFKQRLSS